MIKKHMFAVALLSASCVHAQESRAETQAVRCGALALIHTSLTSASPAFGEVMTDSAVLYGQVFAAGRNVRTGLDATRVEFNVRRESVLREFRDSWKSNLDAIVREAALCNTWGTDFIPKVEAMPSPGGVALLVRVVGEPPVAPRSGEIEVWRPIVPKAFAAWAALDYITPASGRKMLEDSLK